MAFAIQPVLDGAPHRFISLNIDAHELLAHHASKSNRDMAHMPQPRLLNTSRCTTKLPPFPDAHHALLPPALRESLLFAAIEEGDEVLLSKAERNNNYAMHTEREGKRENKQW